jgi:SAM-dependent methyltransferase
VSADAETLKVYAAQAERYAQAFDVDRKDRWLDAFLAAMPEGAHVLELGCGPGRIAGIMQRAGLRVDAVDASPEMAEIAQRLHGVAVRLARFDEIDGVDVYDGIWANFSLLHAPKTEMQGHLARLSRALRPGGRFHIGMKTGTGEARDHLGRFYAFYEEDELRALLAAAGLTVTACDHGEGEGLAGSSEPWIIVTAHG